MKNTKILFFLSLFFLCACGIKETSSHLSKTEAKVSIDYEAEKEAILEVLAGESAAFWNKDFEEYASYWVHEDYIRTMGWWERGGVTVIEGWEVQGNKTKGYMEKSPEPNPTATNLKRENINLRIYKDVAWMTFDQYGDNTGDVSMDMPGLSRETRIFEKVDGQWKIAYIGWLLEG